MSVIYLIGRNMDFIKNINIINRENDGFYPKFIINYLTMNETNCKIIDLK